MPARPRSSVVCVHHGKVLLVRLEDPGSQRTYLFPPGGGIESGETPVRAAEREALEETGYSVKADPSTELVLQYPFVWADTVYDCETHFFRATLVTETPRAPLADPIHRGVVWVPQDAIEATFSYHQGLRTVMLKLVRG